jgi:ribosomal protein S18 acetylase RimI-like enzyme
MQQALLSLRSAGLETAEVRTFDDPVSRGFLEPLGFSVVRRFCWMRRALARVPSGVGEACDAEVVALGSTDGDLAMLGRLSNEAFKDHYNHTPGTLAEWEFATRKNDESGAVTYRTLARLAGEPAGLLVYGIDPKENDYLKKKRGGLRSIGVLKQFRGRGIAKRLMIDAMNHLRREGMEEAELAVDETNVTNAMKLYERLGFAVARRRLVWDKGLAGLDAPVQPA